MHLDRDRLVCSPTDLANFLACRHKVALDRLAAIGRLTKPVWVDPLAEVLRDRGIAHERQYVAGLEAAGLTIEDLTDVTGPAAPARVIAAMRAGRDVIVQARLADDTWFGIADVLRRVETPSDLGGWSYEVHDTKLARETRGGTLLQLCVYTDLVARIQGRRSDYMRVVTPVGVEAYRLDDIAAFYRVVTTRLRDALAIAAEEPAEIPGPVDHCDVCRWWQRCDARRRSVDHLSFVAGLGRTQQAELERRDVMTLSALAALPVPLPFAPARGGRETYERLQDQARLQRQQRESGVPVYERLPVGAVKGLARLPAPSPGDLFLDLEGDAFGRLLELPATATPGASSREYLFGLGRVGADGGFRYDAWWALTDDEERAAFDGVMTEIMSALAAEPSMHVYHYAAYEQTAFKRLAGRYAHREADLDILLRGGRFVDLYAVVRQSVRAGVESYSIKQMEPFYRFVREIDLVRATDERRLVEVALERGQPADVTPAVREAVEQYNRDDCRSTLELRVWLEAVRAEAEAAGLNVPRPMLTTGAASPHVEDRDQDALRLRDQLLAKDDRARYLLAYLVDWHRREERVAWGEYHRLRERADEDLVDEPSAIVGLTFVERVSAPAPGSRKKTVIDRYLFPAQEIDLRPGDQLKLKTDETFGTVDAIDKTARTIDVRKAVAQTDMHAAVVIGLTIVGTVEQERAIRRIAAGVVATDLDDARGDRLVHDLLLARPPRLRSPEGFVSRAGESPADFAVRAAADLDESVLAIQGPPGAGKTFTGARMIAALVAAGRKVGIVATGHKVIRKLLLDAIDAAEAEGAALAAARKMAEDEDPAGDGAAVDAMESNDTARSWLEKSGGRVLGGTAWMWAREQFHKSVDVLVVDEAGQMSLANVLAVSQAARSLVLLGDPQQLEQPQRGTHPDGVDVSALEHLLGGHQTMPEDRGIFLPVTWRLAPDVCAFTSELFYENKLQSKEKLERQRVQGSARFVGAGVWLVEVAHEDCRNASDAEVEAVAGIVADLIAPGVTWTDADLNTRQMTSDDLLIVAPYNAQVNRLQDRLPGFRVGTVDKFQGQEAPVVIYSMTTSRAEDAPRGMEFLFSLNRLNVATSRARAVCILVASPRLFEAACETPRQMRLVNALCRYRERARR